jgi:hypothetical protein
MMLNELEIVAWYSFMKRQEYNMSSAEDVINCAAYCAKTLLNTNEVIEMYEVYFSNYNKQFLSNYKEWKNGPGSNL